MSVARAPSTAYEVNGRSSARASHSAHDWHGTPREALPWPFVIESPSATRPRRVIVCRMPDIEGRATADIPAPLEACRAAVQAVDRYPEWYGMVDAAEALERDSVGRVTRARLATRLALMTVRFTLDLDPRDDGLVARLRDGGGFLERFDGEWTLVEAAEGETRVSWELEAEAHGRRNRILLRPVRNVARRE